MDAVLNWIGQGAVLAMAAAVVLRLLGTGRAQARYLVGWAALLMLLILPLVPSVFAAVSPPRERSATGDAPSAVVQVPHGPWMHPAAVAIPWVLWSMVCSVRVVASAVALRRAARRCRCFPRAMEARLRHWQHLKGRGRPTQLVVSDGVGTAAVMGFRSPVIALAPAVLEQLSGEELDQVVMHEWAHVQRRDTFANLIQLLVGIAVGWHPSVWWMNRLIHAEREAACDEAVVGVTRFPKAYAACLVRLASLQPSVRPPLSAVTAISTWSVRTRIVRVLSLTVTPRPPSSRVAAMCGATVLCALTVGIASVRLVEAGASPSRWAVIVPVRQVPRKAIITVETRSVPIHTKRVSEPAPRESRRPRPRNVPRVGDITSKGLADASLLVQNGQPLSTAENVSTEGFEPVAPTDRSELEPARLPRALLPQQGLALFPASRTVPEMKQISLWSAVTDAGLAAGRGSQKAAVRTAGFFNQFGKEIAGSF